MWAVIVAGFGMLPPTSVRASPRRVRSQSALPTPKVSGAVLRLNFTDRYQSDAGLFKDAFIKAQQENEKLFKADAGEAAPAPATEEPKPTAE